MLLENLGMLRFYGFEYPMVPKRWQLHWKNAIALKKMHFWRNLMANTKKAKKMQILVLW